MNSGDQQTNKVTTASGREVRSGMNESKKSALQKIRDARSGKVKRTEQYEVEEVQQVFVELDEDEYKKRQAERLEDDFIVDDEGYGYKDHGGEIWDVPDQEKKTSSRNKQRKLQKDEQTIQNFMYPVSGLQQQKLRKTQQNTKFGGGKIDEQQSKDIMDSLFQDLDQKDADDLVEADKIVAQQQILNDQGTVAFSKQEEMQFKAQKARQEDDTNEDQVRTSRVQTTAANPFSKKRTIDEITTSDLPTIPSEKVVSAGTIQHTKVARDKSQDDVVMEEEKQEEEAAVTIQKDNSATNIEEDWKKLKLQSEQGSNEVGGNNSSNALTSQDLNLPLNPDGTLSFFWIDAHEEQHDSAIYLFGKVYQPEMKTYVSCSLRVEGLERTLYAIPKTNGKQRGTLTEEENNKQLSAVFTELEEMRKKRFKDITAFKCKGVYRKYAFETPLEHGEHKILKIKYSATMPPLPPNLKGNTFEAIFGNQQSLLELFILKRKIKGPCWLTIQNPQKMTNYRRTWCKHEIVVSAPKDVECTLQDLNKPSPPLVSLTFSTKLTKSNMNTNEIAMVSCIVQKMTNQDGITKEIGLQSFTLLRKLDMQPLPYDLQSKLKQKRDLNIGVFQTERQLLEVFINKLHMIDPDLLVSHNLCGSVIEILLARIQFLKISHWSRLGRVKRGQMPQRKIDSTMHSWIPRQVSCGRLLVDTFLNAKELVRETKYDLGHLASTQLNAKRREVDEDLLPKIYQTSDTLFQLVSHTELDAYLTYKLMMHLQIIPLTKQLTCIAGNLWFRSLQNARAERNEWLLMHEFTSKKFLCPDKKNFSAKEVRKSMFGEEGEELGGTEKGGKGGKGPKRKKAKYGGGLVLEPKAGFYDSIILLLDFNSLYPSIIQEYGLCFTTVSRRHTKNYDGSEIVKPPTIISASQQEEEEDEFDGEMAELPEKTGTQTKDAILPSVLRNLVEKRKLVKKQIKDEKDPIKLGQLDIRQKAFKLTANSMYGCLGFSSSRFHAQAIAALITRTGREILMKTKDIAETKLGYNVVYGDTDSIMINTGTAVLKDALVFGQRLKKEVNVLYKCLEIEIDGVFKSLLLLKKKKYAALNVVNFNAPDSEEKIVVKEVKGLDMVRRDWCELSKVVGNAVLDQVLSGREREQIIMSLNNYFQDMCEKMKSGNINLEQYVITKQLTRAPSEYQDFKALPHVIVADRMVRTGVKTETELVQNFIGYIICNHPEAVEGKEIKFSFEKQAFSFDEVNSSRKKLQPDIDWYTTNQIFPPISRLIEHVDGIDMDFVSQCFGVKAKYRSAATVHTDQNEAALPSAILKSETQKSLQDRALATIKIKCPYCFQENQLNGIFGSNNSKISGLICENKSCQKLLPDALIKNRIHLFLKQLVQLYYEGTYECQEPHCRAKTRQLTVNQKCIINVCKGKVNTKFNERYTNDTMRYLQGLFDTDKYRLENFDKIQKEQNFAIPNENIFADLKNHVDKTLNRSAYNKVNLGDLFAFMDSPQ